MRCNGTGGGRQAPGDGDYAYQSIRCVAVDAIEPCRLQFRRSFSDIDPLARSIKQKGVQAPIMVLPISEDRYRIVYSERRWRAAKEAGLRYIPAIIAEEGESMDEASIIENTHRADLNVVGYVCAVHELSTRD